MEPNLHTVTISGDGDLVYTCTAIRDGSRWLVRRTGDLASTFMPGCSPKPHA
ncbi:hypothetical protein [Phytoactinopolyspora limicola]|uniref:hypothetical protein n=1 Tax=Phytoactinopolyspora limicola TaxID=2715536 RepID=UPI00140B8D75|nr:hypothetical protein [Phytoactinopolyspora limicola]